MKPQIKKILYATDFSKNSSYAFLYAVDLARRYDAQMVILHVMELPPSFTYGGFSGGKLPDEVQMKRRERTVEALKEQLQGFCVRAEAQIGPPCADLVVRIVVLAGHPPEEILNTANDQSCDVIVLGTHGKGFLAHTFLGSVSDAVLHRARKPVFLIPLPSETTAVDWDRI